MNCPNCGKNIDNDSQFCEYCGAKIEKSKRGLWITLAVIALFALVGCSVYMYNVQQESLRIERQRLEEESRRAAERQAELEAQLEAERIAKVKAEQARRAAEQKAKAEAEKARMEAEKKSKAEAEQKRQPKYTPLYKANLLYKKVEYTYCDGKYYSFNEQPSSFSIDLQNLNRKHFRIVFTFEAEEASRKQYPLVLSCGYRILGICLESNGDIHLTTNNQRHEYKTGLSYKINVPTKIDLEYNNGTIVINGETINVYMDELSGDNILSSTNYSNGIAFKGYINAIEVYNY